MTLPDEHQLTDDLHALGRGIVPPPTDPAADLQRGQTRLRRRRAGVALGGAAAVALVAGGASVTAQALGGDPAPVAPRTQIAGSPGSDGAEVPRPEPGAPSAGPDTVPWERFECTYSTASKNGVPAWQQSPFDTVLRTYRTVLADHLDPAGRHLARDVTTMDGTGDPECHDVGLGTTLGWTGAAGPAEVEIDVASTPAAAGVASTVGWSPAGVEGLRKARVDGDTVRTIRTDGLVVTLATDPAVDVTTGQLLAAAADPRLRLPE